MASPDTDEVESNESRWPQLHRLCHERNMPKGLARLLHDGGWVFTPAFLDSGERALRSLENAPLKDDVRTFVDALVRHVTEQTKPAKCLETLIELAAAAWLAERGVLARNNGADVNPANNPIDLGALLPNRQIGIEVKSDFDAFKAEIMGGTFQGDPDALEPKLRARFGAGVRAQFRWLGDRPTREAWGPVRGHVRDQIAARIPSAPEIPPSEDLKFEARLKEPMGGCSGAVVVVSRGPLVGVSVQVAGDGWREIAERITGHAQHKASRTRQDFVLLYVSQVPQPATFDAARLTNVRRDFLANPNQLPPTLHGVIHLRLTPRDSAMGDAVGFLTATSPILPGDFNRTFGLRLLPRSSTG